MNNLSKILEFVKEETLSKEVSEDSDIERDLGWTGDDFHELMEKYAAKFEVDMSKYLWYFHHESEGSDGIGGIFFKSPRRRVEHIAVTPKMLFEFAEKGTWNLKYPEHYIPEKRYDILINQIVFGLFVIFAIWFIVWKYF
ncbi:DUF1493 family protein [Flavobacterium sp. XGLA_31]|uniref:DUF1493 family protein n=1 Tax=Flavobacterium sp. XGLA_31 TaxID=3447666 RepID=UPI003F365515